MDPPIIINGGSVSIEFPEDIFAPEAGKKGKFKNGNKKIKRVEITGDGIDNYDADARNNNVTITIHYDD